MRNGIKENELRTCYLYGRFRKVTRLRTTRNSAAFVMVNNRKYRTIRLGARTKYNIRRRRGRDLNNVCKRFRYSSITFLPSSPPKKGENTLPVLLPGRQFLLYRRNVFSNFPAAVIPRYSTGKIESTGCLNIPGRLIISISKFVTVVRSFTYLSSVTCSPRSSFIDAGIKKKKNFYVLTIIGTAKSKRENAENRKSPTLFISKGPKLIGVADEITR